MRNRTTVWVVLFFFTFIVLHDFGAPAYAATGRPAARVNPKVLPGRNGLPGGLLAGSSIQDNPAQLSSSFGFYAKETEGERFRNVFTTSGRMVLVRNEASVPGDVPILIQRVYSTQNTDSTYFSTGWKLNYDMYLTKTGLGNGAKISGVDRIVLHILQVTNGPRAPGHPGTGL